ncbi:MAG: redoxin domain-containing protein [Pirellulaceae bacterium]|nr:redoxin domain-containing protein [Pirellulaceae bacterium]
MVDVRDAYQRIQAAGGQVVAVTMGSPAQAADFRQRLKLPCSCLADPQRIAYQAWQIPLAGVSQVAGLRVWAPAMRALVRGGAGLPVGDVRQLQGAFLVDTSGVVRQALRGQHSADVATVEQLLKWLATRQPG